MKKFMFGMMVVSVMVFGADLQKMTPQMQVVNPAANIDFSNAKELKFVEAKPAQITIKVPVDLDEPIIGITRTRGGELVTSTKQGLKCWIAYSQTGWGQGFAQFQPVQAGQHTVVVKFNGLPIDKAIVMDTYWCAVQYYVGDIMHDAGDAGDLQESYLLNVEGDL